MPTKIDPVVTGVIIISIVIIVGIIFASSKSSSELPSVSYTVQDKEKPQLQISERSFDLGKMKVSDIRAEDITLKNTGSKPLSISNVYTSCDCTYVEIQIDGKTSPKLSMTRSSWQSQIDPGQSAVLKVTYQPSIMPVQGAVNRSVYFKTNDPVTPDVAVGFKAFVE